MDSYISQAEDLCEALAPAPRLTADAVDAEIEADGLYQELEG